MPNVIIQSIAAGGPNSSLNGLLPNIKSKNIGGTLYSGSSLGGSGSNFSNGQQNLRKNQAFTSNSLLEQPK
jgi:hypothetical protein